MKKDIYESTELEIISFQKEDIITMSPESDELPMVSNTEGGNG